MGIYLNFPFNAMEFLEREKSTYLPWIVEDNSEFGHGFYFGTHDMMGHVLD